MDRFDAFISYSHAADGRLAPALHSGLQRLAKGVFQRRALRVFHDNTGLSTNPHLWGSIESALLGSSWFVLLASPESAQSEWVAREVDTWLANSSVDHVLVVVTDGELTFHRDAGVDPDRTTCLPPALVAALDEEPRWLDLRWARSDEQLDLRNGRFRAAVADLAAPIHGVPKDELEGEDVRQQKRARRLAITGIGAVALLAVASLVAASIAVAQRSRADDATNRATARALAAQAAALSGADIDLGLLLGAEGYRRDPSLDTKTGLLTALDHARGITELIHTLPPEIVDMEISPDRTSLYVSTGSGDVWEVDTTTWATKGEPLLTGIDGTTALATSADGGRLAVATVDGVTVIDLADRSVVATGLGESTTTSLSLSDDGGLLAVGLLEEPVVRVFNVDSGEQVFEVEAGDGINLLLPDGHLAVQGLGSPSLAVYALDGDPTQPLVSRDDLPPGGGLEVSPDGAVLVTGGLSGTAMLVDTATLESLSPLLTVRGSRTGDFFFNPDGSLVGLGSDDGSAGIFDVASATQVLELTGTTGALFSEFTGDTSVVSASFYDEAVVAWDVNQATQIGAAQPTGLLGVTGLHTVNDGSQVVLALPGEVRIADTTDVESVSARFPIGAITRALDVNESAGLVAVYSLGIDEAAQVVTSRTVQILRLPDLTEQTAIQFGENAIENISLSPDGELVAIGLRSGSLTVYDTRTGEEVLAPLPLDQYPCCPATLVWNADGTRLHVGGQDGTLRTLDTSTWTVVSEHVLSADMTALRIGRLTDDGTKVIVPTEAGAVYLVDAQTGEPTTEPYLASGTQFQNAAIVNNGTMLIAVGRDGKTRMWDIGTHWAIGPAMAGHVDFVIALDTTSESAAMTGGAVDGSVITWEFDPASWLDRACTLAGRNMTRAEWNQYVGGDYQATCAQWPEGQ